MCTQLVEVHSACQCLYYQHAIDKCILYPNHRITQRVILVPYACSTHYPASRLKLDSRSESIISQSSTVVSVASSTAAVDKGAVETISRHLLYFKNLRYLWPQLIILHDTREKCLHTIADFLKCFADDVGRLASTEGLEYNESLIRLSACRFVRRTRYSLAQRVWEAHIHSPEVTEDEEESLPRLHSSQHARTSFGDDDSNVIDFVAERFWFGTDPIQTLESSVKAFIEMNTRSGDEYELYLPGREKFQAYFTSFMTSFRGSVKPGSHRITWECVSRPRF